MRRPPVLALLLRDLRAIVLSSPPKVIREAVPCLCHLVMHVTHDATPLEELLVIFAEKLEVGGRRILQIFCAAKTMRNNSNHD